MTVGGNRIAPGVPAVSGRDRHAVAGTVGVAVMAGLKPRAIAMLTGATAAKRVTNSRSNQPISRAQTTGVTSRIKRAMNQEARSGGDAGGVLRATVTAKKAITGNNPGS